MYIGFWCTNSDTLNVPDVKYNVLSVYSYKLRSHDLISFIALKRTGGKISLFRSCQEEKFPSFIIIYNNI